MSTSITKPSESAELNLDFETGLCTWRIGHGRPFEQAFPLRLPPGTRMVVFGQELRVSQQVKFMHVKFEVSAYRPHDFTPLVIIGPSFALGPDGRWRQSQDSLVMDDPPRRLMSTDDSHQALTTLAAGKPSLLPPNAELEAMWVCGNCGTLNSAEQHSHCSCGAERMQEYQQFPEEYYKARSLGQMKRLGRPK